MSTFSTVLDNLKGEYNHLNPILITAPTQRCGTTLLQRAINSGGQAIIYGENFALLESMSLGMGAAVQNYEAKSEVCDATLKAFNAGKTNIDGTALFPEFEGYIQQLLRGYYENLNYYHRYSAEKNFSHWGFKHQPKNLAGFVNSVTLFPNARQIFIYRDVINVAKSLRARWPQLLDSDAKLIAFGKRWADNSQQLLSSPHLKLTLQYEALIADTAKHIPLIEEAVGVKLNAKEFKNKVNNHFAHNEVGDIGLAAGKYTPPAEISVRETMLMLTHALDVYNKLGYEVKK